MIKESQISVHILAGGKGTRMSSDQNDNPKFLNNVGEESLIRRHINQLVEAGFEKIVIHTGIQHEKVQEHLKDLDFLHFVKDEKPAGTLTAILNGLEYASENLLIIYADTIHNLNLINFIERHIGAESDFSALIHPNNHPFDSDQVIVDNDGKITNLFLKSMPKPEFIGNLCLAALLMVSKDLLEEYRLNNSIEPQRSTDLVSDLMTYAISINKRIYGFKDSGYIHDVGTPNRLHKVRKDLKNNFGLTNSKRPAVFLDRDGTIIVEDGYLTDPYKIELISGAADFIKYCNERGILTIVITNQPVIARGECSFENLNLIHKKLEEVLAERSAYLDEIYFCPHHPDKGFENEVIELKINCNCRKPNTGLLKRAFNDFPCDKANCFFIGNSVVDRETAKNFGIKYFEVNSHAYEQTFSNIQGTLERLLS